MNEQELRERIGVAIESLIAPQVGQMFPAAAVDIRYEGETLYTGTFGEVSPGQPTTPNTLFDLDTLTEVFTATAFLRLVELGRLWIDTPVSVVLPDIHEAVMYWHLLTHTSGLPESINLCRLAEYEERIAAIESTLLTDIVGARTLHSEIGYMLLGLTIESLTDLPYDEALAELVLQPLGLHAEFPPLSRLAFVAPTAPMGSREAYDSNARCLDGVSGHAGLFGTVSDVATLAQLYVDGGLFGETQLLSEPVVYEAMKPQTPSYGLGWSIIADRHVARAGRTGVSVQADLDHQLVIALATNAIYYSTDQAGLAALETTLHATLTNILDS